MRTNKKIEVEVLERKCDFCEAVSIYHHGHSSYGNVLRYNVDVEGGNKIYSCQICKKDICEKHSFKFCDNYVDDAGYSHYNSIITCLQCKPIVEKIWEEEKGKDADAEFDGRLVYLVEARLKGEKK
jgi:hypothetical protein